MIDPDPGLPSAAEPLPELRVHEASRWLQARCELQTRAHARAFLARAGLTTASWRMRELAILDALERDRTAARLADLARLRQRVGGSSEDR